MTTQIDNHDVFLSYSSKDRQPAARIAQGLKKHGLSVWWDRELLPGEEFLDSLENFLQSSKCVVVLWSSTSVKSRYVRNESEYGANNDKLVPVLIEKVEIPFHVRNIQTLDLADWKGDPNDPSFVQLVRGLQTRIEGAPPVGETPAVPHSKIPGLVRRWFWVGALLIFALGLGAVWNQKMRDSGDAPIHDLADLTQVPLTGDGNTHDCAISPDGMYLLYAHDESGQYSLRLKQIDSGTERVLIPRAQQGIRSPIFSPEGDFIYYSMAGPVYSIDNFATYDLYRVSLAGGQPQKIVAGIIGRRFACSPLGDRLAFMKSDGDSIRIMTARTNGTDEREVGVRLRDISVPPCLAYSVDGLQVYSTSRDSAGADLKIVASSTESDDEEILPGGFWQKILDLHTLTDGSGLLVVGQPAQGTTKRHTDLWYLPAGADAPLSVTRDLKTYNQVTSDRSGRRLALSFYAVKRTLRMVGMDNPHEFRDISTDIVVNGKVVWSRQGGLLANQTLVNRVGMVTMNTDGSGVQQILADVDYVSELDLSPDGRTLAFTVRQERDFTIWLANSDGTSPRPLADSGGIEHFPKFSPDNEWLLFARKTPADGRYILMRYDLAEGTSTRLAETAAMWPEFSSDGKRIAAFFRNPATRKYRLGYIAATGEEPVFPAIDPAFEFLCWNPEGTGFTCYDREGVTPNIWNVPLGPGEPVQLTDFPPGHLNIPDVAWNAAGDSMVVSLELTAFDAVMLEKVGIEK
jgi:dipeptidyl aminopeptidase/acylaminoacyl peptidase